MTPYFGVAALAFKARNKAFSAPKICTVDEACLARLSKDLKIVREKMKKSTSWNHKENTQRGQ